MPSAVARRRPLPRPSPETDPRFRKVMEDLKRGAARSKAHPPAGRKAAEASAAAKGPPNERLAAGKAQQVEKIKEAPSKKPESSSFLALLQAEIAKAMPKTLADTEKFMKGGSSEQLKGSLKGNVSKQKDQATGGVKSASTEAPKEAGAAKESKPIPAEPAPPSPAVNGAEAMPAPKPDADVSLQDSKQETEQQMKDAEVTTPQLKKANDPRFSAVLTAKDDVAKQADAAPAQYRAQEKEVLSASGAAAKAAAVKGAAAMVHVRGGSNSAVLSRQAAAKARDEAKRKEVTDQIEAIYNRTKVSVEAKLSTLETEVGAMFDAGTDAALKAMTDYVEARIDAYKEDRYSGLIGKGRWIRDQFKGLPEEANAFYVEGRALFTRLMNTLVVKVAAIVEQRLKEAKDEVAKGQAEIKAYVASQPKELQTVAQNAQKEVAGRFQELERSIDDKKQQLAEQLAQKYKEGFDKANEALQKIQDANKGLVAGFIEKLKAVIEAIIEFKNKLMGILRKGAAAIKLILGDPIGFLGNLLSAIKQGFSQFASNIWTHLKAGFMKWLFGALAETGIEIPTDLSLPSILKLVLGVLGITYERMRAKAVKLVGERAVKFIEKLVEYIKVLFTGGFAALWEKVKEDLSNLKEMVIDAIQDWLITTIIKKAVAKIATMFNPVGAIVQAILAIVDVVIFVVEKASQILEFIQAVVESISAIAQGAIAGAANWIEKSLANMIPLLIGFLAQLLGLGGISKKIKETIQKVQSLVDKAIDKAIAKIVAVVKKLFAKLTGKDNDTDKDKEKKPADKEPQEEIDRPVVNVPFPMSGKGHHLIFEPKGDSVEVSIASDKLPYTAEFSRAHIAIDNFKHYASTVEDPVIKNQYQTEILPKIESLQSPAVSKFTEIYRARFPKGRPGIPHEDAKAQVQKLVKEAEALLETLKAWAAATGIADLSPGEIEKTINEKGKAIWSKRHQEIRTEIVALLAGFDYKGKKISFTGSAQTGWRKEHKGLTHFDASDFDVDMFVIHPADFATAEKNKANVEAGKIFPSTALTPDLSAKSKEVANALAKKFPGVKRIGKSYIVLKKA